METVSVPKFRTAKRLVMWMERNWTRLPSYRLDPDRERVFFRTKKEQPAEVAACVARYSFWAGALSPELESLLKCHNDSVVVYLVNARNARNARQKDQEVGPGLVDCLAGDSRNLFRVAKSYGRLPSHLEDTIGDPKYAFLYAKEVLRGRLPRNLEDVFFKDVYFAAKYAFEVIRGFSPVKLPEELHAFMVMKSFEDPEDENIRTYMEAVESDPSKVGNSENRVR